VSAEFRVDGNPLPPPSAVTVTPQVLAESARALDGTLHTDYRATKRVVRLQWQLLSPADMQTVQAALSPFRTVQLSWDEPGGTVTVSAIPMPGSRGLAAGRSIWDSAAQRWWWADVQLEFEEV
jgi:hypothetical protein